MVSQSIFLATRGQCDHRISSYSMRILSRTTACETKQKHGDFPNSTGHEQKAMGRRHIPSHNSFEHDFPAQKLGNKPVPSRVPHHFHWKYKSIENARTAAFSGKRNTLLWKSNRNRKGGTCKDTLSETFDQSINHSIVMNYTSIGPNVEATTNYII